VEELETTTPDLLGSMPTAAVAMDQRALRIGAHSLQANGRDFGKTPRADLCGALEADCHDGAAAIRSGRVAAIAEELERARATLPTLSVVR